MPFKCRLSFPFKGFKPRNQSSFGLPFSPVDNLDDDSGKHCMLTLDDFAPPDLHVNGGAVGCGRGHRQIGSLSYRDDVDVEELSASQRSPQR